METESQSFSGTSFPVRNLLAGDESLNPVERHSRLKRGYMLLGLVVLAAYVAAAVYFLRNPGFPSEGPGDLAHANLKDDAIPQRVLDAVWEARPSYKSRTLAGVDVQDAVGGPVWVLYSLTDSEMVVGVLVLDGQSLRMVRDTDRIKPLGAWPHIGFVKAFEDWATGFFALLGILLAVMRWAPSSQVRGKLARREPRGGVKAVFAARPIVSVACATVIGSVLIWVAPGWNRHQRWLWTYRCIAAYLAVIGLFVVLGAAAGGGDSASFAALMIIGGGSALAWLYGWRLLRPSGARLTQIEDGAEPAASIMPPAAEPATAGAPKPAIGLEPPPRASSVPTAPPPSPPVTQAPARTGGAPTMAAPTVAASADEDFKVVPPFECPTLDDVGGMESVKQQLRDTVGLVLAFPGEALELKVAFNGILLFGPPGTGKTFLAKAAAGEYGCNFLSLGSVELTSSFRGESAKKIARAFDIARANVPVIMFFDEFDAIGTRRDDTPGSSDDLRSLTQLLRSLEGVRDSPEVIVVAATNHFDQLDPAVIRPGRFDRRIRVDMPDSAARASIFEAQLSGRPTAEDIDVDELARLAEGLSAAAIADIVNTSALNVLADLRAGSETSEITQELLEATTRGRGGKDRPSSESWSWDSLILPEHTKRELQELQKLIEDSERARQLGIAPPSGALLYGPPGTGKTMIARVLAAEAKCSFYPVTGSDIVSKWLGQSQRNVERLFSRAREHRPSIIFLDEIDAIAPSRGGMSAFGSSMDQVVNQLLQEIDGLGSGPGIFVLGATNRRHMIDEALLRGGRLGRQIEVGLPDAGNRAALLEMFSSKMPLREGFDPVTLTDETEGLSGADIRALCQEAAIQALMRTPQGREVVVGPNDFESAFAARSPRLV
ncbi:MAG: AAA family ATPase [Chloroflexi bacterium]|nr:AAA family ATPase [Chloroflexota bacterium]MCY3938016.1 AAA family ATPase [Chloroflexota bacterium]